LELPPQELMISSKRQRLENKTVLFDSETYLSDKDIGLWLVAMIDVLLLDERNRDLLKPLNKIDTCNSFKNLS